MDITNIDFTQLTDNGDGTFSFHPAPPAPIVITPSVVKAELEDKLAQAKSILEGYKNELARQSDPIVKNIEATQIEVDKLTLALAAVTPLVPPVESEEGDDDQITP